MRAIRDILDKQLMDRNNRQMGKVDGIVMQIREGEPPRLAFIEVGIVTEARRLSTGLEAWANRLARRFHANESYRIPFSKVALTGINVTVNVDAEKTPALAFELWLRKKVVGRIPGA